MFITEQNRCHTKRRWSTRGLWTMKRAMDSGGHLCWRLTGLPSIYKLRNWARRETGTSISKWRVSLQKEKNWPSIDLKCFSLISSSGSSSDCENYGTTIRVSKSLENERYSTVYNGAVCPIDIKGAVEVEAHGCGLNIR